LNSITSTSNLETINYFDTQITDFSILIDKIATLLTWAVTPLQFGDHRPFAAVTLLGIWRTKNDIFRHRYSSNEDFIHDQIFDWLDSSEVTQDPANLAVIASFVGQLIQHNLFSYEMYIQRLIARGELGLSFKEVDLANFLHKILTFQRIQGRDIAAF
jgi:mediator of RNA polymerase II transcription subunit 12, fungi type